MMALQRRYFQTHKRDQEALCSPSSQAHVLGQRPSGQAVVEPPPERRVVEIMEPHRSTGGLQLDKGQQRGRVDRRGEQMLRDEEERVVHWVGARGTARKA